MILGGLCVVRQLFVGCVVLSCGVPWLVVVGMVIVVGEGLLLSMGCWVSRREKLMV